MGKIKSKQVKRTANLLIKEGVDFAPDFEKNKRILGNTMPSKKLRNQTAGYLVRVKKQEEKNKLLIEKSN